MGKAQSKRSVDITTEAKKDDVIEEGTGKMGKIEDVDQLKPQVNGDTHHNETDVADKEKSVDAEGTENEKDLSTEKEQQPQIEPKTNLEGGGDDATAAVATTPSADNKPVVENGNGNDDTLNESKNPAETSTTAATENGDDSSKKPKKEKVKKKWSLRSISFGKKDKQKPAKKEEGTTNGDCEKVPEEVAEEVTKSGEESTAAAANVEGTTSSPGVEEKSPASPVEEKAAEETKETVVVNGTSEPAKEEKPASEPTPEVVAVPAVAVEAAVAAVVVEEKQIEKEEPAAVSNVTEEIITTTVKTDIVVEAAEPNPTENSKSNETEEPVTAKIEVKAESIQDDNAHKSSEEEKEGITEIQQEIETEELKKIINDDGDSESAQNLPPPPLPCTSPPSQVSVFALSDSKDHEQDQQLSTLPPTSVPVVGHELPIAAESVGSPAADVVLPPVSSDIKDDVIVTDEKKIKTELEINLESTIASPEIPEEVNPPPIVEEILSQKIEVVGKSPDEALCKILNEKHEGSEINPEQIAQTIALIDEVTQEAVTISQNKLQKEEESSSAISSSETESLKKEEEKIEISSTELSSNDPHPGDNTIPSISETNIPSVLVDEKQLSESKSETDDVQSKSEIVDVQVPQQIDNLPSENLEQKSQNQTELIGDHGDQTQQIAAAETIESTEVSKKNIAIDDPINIEQPKEILDIIVPQTAEEPSDKTETNLADDTKPTTETEASSQVAKSKENGIGENHAAETSATESLNGHEHKTIEEIVTDCSSKLNIELTTDIVVKVTE